MQRQRRKSGRIAAEGIVKTVISEDGKNASIVEVNSETDFVAKNEKFQDLLLMLLLRQRTPRCKM